VLGGKSVSEVFALAQSGGAHPGTKRRENDRSAQIGPNLQEVAVVRPENVA
jgi:hypothetical protein